MVTAFQPARDERDQPQRHDGDEDEAAGLHNTKP